MKAMRERKGSALLIVLGMLSFMVVSAVSFSIYMRQGRAPSSYLRRNISSRYLTRAALAKAIEALDGDFMTKYEIGLTDDPTDKSGYFYGVYDDPYPGLGTDASQPPLGNGVLGDGDYWYARVFAPFGLLQSSEGTVATLPLEGLAYLPPAIANDVRAISRLTRTAQWRSFPYESGRYAYTIVNVSDCFDINKLSATEARNSSSSGRISLCSLFADPNNLTGIDTVMGGDVQKILDKSASVGADTPFVSLADFTALAGSQYAPFMRYIGTSGEAFTDNNDYNAMGGSLFITDTWFPPTNSSSVVVLDLEGDGQPFTKSQLGLDNYSALTQSGGITTQGGNVLKSNIGVGMVCLKDYLDSDSVPTSLALPTVEATPMIVGISAPPMTPGVNARPNLGPFPVTDTVTDPTTGSMISVPAQRTITPYVLDTIGPGSGLLAGLATVYPFKRMATTGRSGRNFQYRAIMKAFMAPDTLSVCRFINNPNALRPGMNEWTAPSGVQVIPNSGVLTLYTGAQNLTYAAGDITTAASAVGNVNANFGNGAPFNMTVYYHVEDTYSLPNPTTGTPTPRPPLIVDTFDGLNGDPNAFCPMLMNGSIDSSWASSVKTLAELQSVPFDQIDPLNKPGPYRLCAAVWAQILDSSGKVVDMVPAYCEDDADWLGYSGGTAQDIKLGEDIPMMYFKTDQDIKFGGSFSGLSMPATYSSWGALYAVDPRFNFAPEDWFTTPGSTTATGAGWLTQIGAGAGASTSAVLGQDGRDHDIFMFVSDQDYMQSIGELQFLPNLEDLASPNNSKILGGSYVPSYSGSAFSTRSSVADALTASANGPLFWRTYTAFPTDISKIYEKGRKYNAIYDLPYNGKTYCFMTGSTGFKVNPYSEDKRVIMAALANTPFDYYVASTNTAVAITRPLTMNDLLTKYSFGEDVACAKFDPGDIEKVADAIQGDFRDAALDGDSDWLSAFLGPDTPGNWNWAGDDTTINDANMNFWGFQLQNPTLTLHGVDRKFLYSFWRECFGNRQQLYLIFVRAEPAAVGGGGTGANTTSQLGGRAVALVWRDPAPPSNGGTRPARKNLHTNRNAVRQAREDFPPHRTRVLFYHQFD